MSPKNYCQECLTRVASPLLTTCLSSCPSFGFHCIWVRGFNPICFDQCFIAFGLHVHENLLPSFIRLDLHSLWSCAVLRKGDRRGCSVALNHSNASGPAVLLASQVLLLNRKSNSMSSNFFVLHHTYHADIRRLCVPAGNIVTLVLSLCSKAILDGCARASSLWFSTCKWDGVEDTLGTIGCTVICCSLWTHHGLAETANAAILIWHVPSKINRLKIRVSWAFHWVETLKGNLLAKHWLEVKHAGVVALVSKALYTYNIL